MIVYVVCVTESRGDCTHRYMVSASPNFAGVKINNAEAIDEMGLDRDRLARLSVESYLQQLLRYGLFHADPHPLSLIHI